MLELVTWKSLGTVAEVGTVTDGMEGKDGLGHEVN